MSNAKQLSNPFSTGGGGHNFETRVQALFVVLMLTGGFVPCLPGYPIGKVKLQGKYAGYDTDDLIVFAKSPDGSREMKLLGQVKSSIRITANDKVFGEVIQSAWRDFNNSQIFTKGNDVIALITGPLSDTDTCDVRDLLEWARHAESADDFLTKVEKANFSSNGKRKKLCFFRVQLNNANGDKNISDEELWQFLKAFHLLGCDLDVKAGVTLSLLHSLIGQYSPENAHALWTQIVDEVQSVNQNAGVITIDSLPDTLRSAFRKRGVETIPPELVNAPSSIREMDWNQVPFASELAIANLLGSWDENSDADKEVVKQLANEDFIDWITKIRETLQSPESPVALKNGVWTVIKRQELWQALGPRLFDTHLDIFKKCVVDVLTERDPQFDLTPEERFAAGFHGKVLKHSHVLRKGFAESLALLGSCPGVLNNCSLNKPETIAVLTVREIFANADWVLWASLNDLLPLLAEAVPDEFLSSVESALQENPCPFDTLFSQEGTGITGRNYLTGLLWALETLAWDEQYLVRVTVVLGELASHDPGGNWANRPANSLTTVFLPWLPQTTATIEKREVAVQTLLKENPEVAWKLLLSLLPNQHQSSSGSHKPVWRKTIPDDWEKKVSNKEYRDQVSNYSEIVVGMAKGNTVKLSDLIEYLDGLPSPAFDRILECIASDEIIAMPEGERIVLWTRLTKFASKHKRFADAKWALGPDLVAKIEGVVARLAPKNPLNLHRGLFREREFDLYEENGNWEEQQKKIENRRQQAVGEVLDFDGIESVSQFAETVESPWSVGFSLGSIAGSGIDSSILPNLLEVENKKLTQLASGFVWGRHQSQGWPWVDRMDTTGWSQPQIGQFLASLPFTGETWEWSKHLLGQAEAEYWSKANVTPPFPTDCDPYLAVDKLIEYGRPNAAIDCLSRILHAKKTIDPVRAVKALLSPGSSTETAHSMDVYNIVEIIKALQDDPATNPDELFRVERFFLPLLLDSDTDASPRRLEQRLASDPDFFCEMIRLIYRSTNVTTSNSEPTEQQRAMATNVWRLLREWKMPPGTQLDGSFSVKHFRLWINSVQTSCSDSGHLEVALSHIGGVLIHCPPDSDGFWINRAVAEVLNGRDAEKMRNGFCIGICNSRGVHWIDPTGRPEKEFAAKYRQQAEEVENAGYQRLAITLKNLAEGYERDAAWIIEQHRRGS